jgi:photosystem II stability/assembly factor-like uncharacterized protein
MEERAMTAGRSAAIVLVLGGVAAPGFGQTPHAPNTWTPAGPQFSTILSLERNPQAPGTLLAGTYFGGLYRSTDHGFSWRHMDTDFSSRSIFAIAYAPTRAGAIYAGTFRGGVYRSLDDGASWETINAGLTDLDVQAAVVDPFDADHVLVATSNGGVFGSLDAGTTWSRVDAATPPLRGRTIVFDPVRKGVVYLGTIGTGAFRSVDGGASWRSFSDGITAASVLSLRFGAAPAPALYAGTDLGAFKLQDAATTWTSITGTLPGFPVESILPHPTARDAVFAATRGGVFYLTNDEAATAWQLWTPVPMRVLATDPTGSVIHAATIHGGLQATTDIGATWHDANRGIQNLFVGALAVVRNGSTPVVYAGSDFAVHRGVAGAWDTSDQRQGIFDIQADPSNPATLYMGTERAGVWKTSDGGGSWTPAASNIVPAQIYGLAETADGRSLFAATSSGVVRQREQRRRVDAG